MMQHTCVATMAALILVASLNLLACQPDASVPPFPALDNPRMAEVVNDSLRLAVQVPARVAAGEEVTIVLRATNVSARTLDLYLQGREPTADVIVRTSSNEIVWHSLAGVALPAILRLESLAPDASLTVRVEWNQVGDDGARVPPGMYQVSARVVAEDADALRFPPVWVEIAR